MLLQPVMQLTIKTKGQRLQHGQCSQQTQFESPLIVQLRPSHSNILWFCPLLMKPRHQLSSLSARCNRVCNFERRFLESIIIPLPLLLPAYHAPALALWKAVGNILAVPM